MSDVNVSSPPVRNRQSPLNATQRRRISLESRLFQQPAKRDDFQNKKGEHSRSPNVFKPNFYGCTVKIPELVAVPPGVVIPILPVFAPVGTFAVTFVSEITVKLVAFTPPKVTFVV